MAEYSADFEFKNNTGQTIVSGHAEHKATNFDSVKIELAGLPTDTTSEKRSFSTESTSIDHWYIDFVVEDGYKYKTEHDCAVFHEDANQTVKLGVTLPSSGHDGTFNITPPRIRWLFDECRG